MGPTKGEQEVSVSMNDNFYPHITWSVPLRNHRDPALTHVRRTQGFYTWLVAKNVNTSESIISLFFELLLCCNLHRCSIHILLSWFLLLELEWSLISNNQDLGWKFQQYVVKFCFFGSFWSLFWARSRIAESHSKQWIRINYNAMIDNICVDFPVSALYNSRWSLWHCKVWLTNHTPPGFRL